METWGTAEFKLRLLPLTYKNSELKSLKWQAKSEISVGKNKISGPLVSGPVEKINYIHGETTHITIYPFQA